MDMCSSRLRLVVWCFLLSAVYAAGAFKSPFRVYNTCTTPDGVQGQCRTVPRAQQPTVLDQQAVVKAVLYPIDMQLPCENASRACVENVDVALAPIQPPSGDDVASCSVTLMPWSPFPCTYNTQAYYGVEGQNKTDWCYSQQTKPGTPEYEYATDLTTDGYSNLFHGVIPDTPCGGAPVRTEGSSQASPAGPGPEYGRHFSKVLLTLNFRVAAGRQFDRTYWFQIGKAVIALGTLAEPMADVDKFWTATIDITYLQAYLAPGLTTYMSLANVLSNTYNVPLWAQASIQYFWSDHSNSRVYGDAGDMQQPLDAAEASAAVADATLAMPVAGSDSSEVDTDGSDAKLSYGYDSDRDSVYMRPAAAAADVPDEVIPLVPNPDSQDSVVVLAGKGDSPPSWPGFTFQLPTQLSELGNIYRAQLLVTPKADACEEFWALDPSGSQTNDTCNGVSTGEPYREVRVYVNGQVAGFSPIYYTMYTGGVNPRLWTAIPGSYAYLLPTFTFDLSPWLPQLNAAYPRHSSDALSHSIRVELVGATNNGWILSNTLLLWRAEGPYGHPEVVSGPGEVRVVTSPGFNAPLQSDCEFEDVPGLTVGNCSLDVTDRSLKATAVLHWRGRRWHSHVKYFITRYTNFMTFAFNDTYSDQTWNQVTHHQAEWSVSAQRPVWEKDTFKIRSKLEAHAQGAAEPEGTITAKTQPVQASTSSMSWSDVVTQQFVRYEWLNAGGTQAGAAYEYSFNTTLLEPTVFAEPEAQASASQPTSRALSGNAAVPAYDSDWYADDHPRSDALLPDVFTCRSKQRHYQRAIQVFEYGPQPCVLTGHVTHTASLNMSSAGSYDAWPIQAHAMGATSRYDAVRPYEGLDSQCVRHLGTTEFCAPFLFTNTVAWDDGCC